MKLPNAQIFTEVSASGSYTSDIIPIQSLFGFSLQASYTTATGTISFQVSNQSVEDQSPSDDLTVWTPLSETIVCSGNGNKQQAFPENMNTWLRVVYSGTGSGKINAWFQGKGI